MLNFTFTAELVKFDSEAFLAAADAKIQRLLKEGMQQFLKAALRTIPIRTGFLRGAFVPIEKAALIEGANIITGQTTHSKVKKGQREQSFYNAKFGRKQASIGDLDTVAFRKIRPTAMKPEYYYSGDGKIFKSPEAGADFGIVNKMGEKTGNFYEVDVDINIDYFAINDTEANPRTPETPWNSFSNGRLAMIEFLSENLSTVLEDTEDFFYVSQTRRVGK